MGALFALLPAYYLYVRHDVQLREAATSMPEASADASPRSEKPSGTGRNRIAARLTYELSRPPREAPVVPRAPPPVASSSVPAKNAASSAATPSTDEATASRIANARPINATPPDPRDTTRGIEKESRRLPEARESTRQSPVATPAATPRYIEGRDLVIPPPKTGSEKKPIETRTVIAAGPPVAGVSPIGPPPSQSVGSALARGDGAASDIDSRLAATRDWLAAAPASTHTIQLFGTGNEEHLKSHLRTLSNLLEPAKIYVFRTVAQGKPSTTVVYGSYPDRQSAVHALAKLPSTVGANQPVLRTVKGIRSEIAQHKADAQ